MSEHVFEVESGESIRLPTKGKRCEKDIIVTAKGGSGEDEFYNAVTENGTNFEYMFYNRKTLQTAPMFDTSQGVDFNRMFYYSGLSEAPNYDYSNCKTVNAMFHSTAITHVPSADYPKCENFFQMCFGCKSLKTVGVLGTSKGETLNQMFQATIVETIEGIDFSGVTTEEISAFFGCSKLHRIGINGVIKYTFLVKNSPLDIDTAKAIINALVDYSGTDNEFVYSITFSTTTLAYLEAEGATAPNGGTWFSYIEDKKWNY